MEGHGTFQRDRGTAPADFHSQPDVNAYFDCAQYKHAESHLDLEPGRAEHADSYRDAFRYSFPRAECHANKMTFRAVL